MIEIDLFARKLYNVEKNEVGVAITAHAKMADEAEKKKVQTKMEEWATNGGYYPRGAFSIFSAHEGDMASLVIFKDINNLSAERFKVSL